MWNASRNIPHTLSWPKFYETNAEARDLLASLLVLIAHQRAVMHSRHSAVFLSRDAMRKTP